MAEPVTQPSPITPPPATKHSPTPRLLHWAEDETDLSRMERITELGNSWLALAAVLAEDTTT